MDLDATAWLLIATTAITGVGAGATLDQAIKQLPARHRIGSDAYAEYVRAADLANGLKWYPALGISTTLVTAAAVIVGFLDDPDTASAVGLGAVAVGLLAQLASSSQAAPTLHRLRKGADPATTLDKFSRWNAVRGVAVTFTLVAAAYTLASWVTR